MIEAASGQSYHDYLTARVYSAAGLTETGVFRNDTDTVGFSPAYGPGGIAPSPTYDPSILVGAGSLRSTASDLLSWCQAFNADILNPEAATFFHGWGVRSKRSEKTGFFYRQLHTTIEAERDAVGRVTALNWGGSWRLPRSG